MLKSAKQAKTTCPALILIDKTDYEKNAAGYTEIGNDFLPEGWKIHITDGVTMADKISDVWDIVSSLEWTGLLNDDFEFKAGWDFQLLRRLDGKNFVSANDGTVRSFRLPVTATAWSMPLLNAVGWKIYPPGMKHLFIDNIWHDLGRATGCWRPVPSSIVIHNHVLFNKAEADETHASVYNSVAWQRDEGVYNEIHKNEFAAIVEKINKFRNIDKKEEHNPQIAKARHETLMAP